MKMKVFLITALATACACAAALSACADIGESAEVQRAIRGVLDLELTPPAVETHPDPAKYGFDTIDFAMNGGIALTAKGRMYLVWFGGEDGSGSYLTGTWSDDGGRTWTDTRFVVGSKDPVGRIGMSDLRLTVLVGNVWFAPDGSIYVSYDHDRNTKNDEILLARFTEDEVLVGRIADPSSFLKRTVFLEKQKGQ